MEKVITIRQLQEIYLVMLSEFHEFCVANNLTYYMVDGTLLGAVREQGFIPWDDDVDIAMPRADYERFIKSNYDKIILCPPGKDKQCCFPYTKLFHAKVPVVYVEDEEFGMQGEVMVQFDIYPVDGLGNDYRKAQKYAKKISWYKYLLYLNQSNDRSKNILKNVVLEALRWLPGARIAKHIDLMMRKYRKKESLFLTGWREGAKNGNVVAAEVFGNPALLPFDRLHLYAPQDYDTYLTNIYGDYKKPRRDNIGLRHDIKNRKAIKSMTEA